MEHKDHKHFGVLCKLITFCLIATSRFFLFCVIHKKKVENLKLHRYKIVTIIFEHKLVCHDIHLLKGKVYSVLVIKSLPFSKKEKRRWHFDTMARQFITYCFPVQKEIQTGLSVMCLSCNLYLTPGQFIRKWWREKLLWDDSIILRHHVTLLRKVPKNTEKCPTETGINWTGYNSVGQGPHTNVFSLTWSDVHLGLEMNWLSQGFLREEVEWRRLVFYGQLVYKNWLSYKM